MLSFDALGYIRVSTPQQAGPQRTSLADQETAIREVAAQLGRVMGDVYCDAGVSGDTAVDRPAFMTMLADAVASPRPAHTPGVILALNASRWGRFTNPSEDAAITFRLRRAGWVVRFVDEDADLPTVAPIPLLSAGVTDAIENHLAALRWMPDGLGHFTTILGGALAVVPTDRQGLALLRLSNDLARHGSRSALMRVLAGEVDLVGLLGEGAR